MVSVWTTYKQLGKKQLRQWSCTEYKIASSVNFEKLCFAHLLHFKVCGLVVINTSCDFFQRCLRKLLRFRKFVSSNIFTLEFFEMSKNTWTLTYELRTFMPNIHEIIMKDNNKTMGYHRHIFCTPVLLKGAF